jgi:hypothetical protein
MSKAIGTVGEVQHIEEWTAEERAQIIEEANRIVSDPAFKSSRRCVALFSLLVDRSLVGDHDAVKERTLGIEVFGRVPNYDTATDPVVRMAANEIRKRLAQWYQEPARHRQVRIRLNSGTYLLKFEFVHPEFVPERLEALTRAEAPSPTILTEAETETLIHTQAPAIPEFDTHPDVIEPSPVLRARSRKRWIWGVAAIAIVAAAVGVTLRHFDAFQSRQYLVWKPLLNSTEPLTISIPEVPPQLIGNESLQWQLNADEITNRVAPSGSPEQNANTITPIADAAVAQSITRWVTLQGQNSVLHGSSAMTMRNLRQGPVVLVGGFNPWSLVLLSNLRYAIRMDTAAHAMWIQDAQNTSKRDWMIDGNGQPKDVDYAVISRLFDPETGHWILSFGGLRKQGTRAARDLLIDSSYAKLLPPQIRSTGNFQIVLKTNIVNGSAGPPQILAVHTW